MDRNPPQAPSGESLKLGYEPSGVSVRALGIAVACLALAAVLIHSAVWFVAKEVAEPERGPRNERTSALAGQAPLSSAPPLQPSPQHDRLPYEDLALMHKQEDEMFTRMGWMDPSVGSVRVPDSILAQVAQEAAARKISQPAATQPAGSGAASQPASDNAGGGVR